MRMLAWLVLGFLALAPASALAQDKTVHIGDTALILPQMEGFQEVYGKDPAFDKIVDHFVPEGNRLLAVYLSDADAAAIKSAPQAGLKKYVLVQANAQDISLAKDSDFQSVKEEFANQIGSGSWQDDKTVNDAVDNLSGYVQEQLKQPAELKIGDTRYLGKIADTDDALAVMMLANYGVTTEQGTQSYPVIAGLSVLKLKSRVVLLFVYSNYLGGADVNFVTQTLRKFIAETVAANNAAPAGIAPAPPPASADDMDTTEQGASSGPDIGNAMRWATEAAVLIALLAVCALLLPKIIRLLGRKDETL